MTNRRDVRVGDSTRSTSIPEQAEVPAHLQDVVNDMELQRQQGTLSDDDFQRRLSRILERDRRAANRQGAQP
ncbi:MULTISPECIES: hypothetical protein [Aquabacterium]|uniref:hypothetical protein n=1 Tax=Aquabacterium TaxID=92793 RepID=UPI00105E4CBF|nr:MULTISPECIES: hypothetical protein [Aquabacterium]